MKFHSTRDLNKVKYDSAHVIKQGLASDGGLFVPERIPQITQEEIRDFCSLSYPELAATILSKFLTDYSYNEIYDDCKKAYEDKSFPHGACPLVRVDDATYSLELWHGPTCAFKDMALQIMPRLLSRALVKTNEDNDALILVATSGDTGKAALEGYKDVDRIKICVFYPEHGVSTVQKLQMMTQTGNNVHVCGVEGNFDNIQTGVKEIFSNNNIATELLEKGYILSSANSINFGRLAPQIVYYVSAYCELINNSQIKIGDHINVCVPTGNFGNILAAYMAKLMGLPINKLICASNSNNVLTEFLNSGRYDRNREFYLTASPSMDILISSNLERLLYLISGTEKTVEWMSSLKENGYYQVDEETLKIISEHFTGFYADEIKTKEMISKYYTQFDYLMDTHTAVAFSALNQYRNETNDLTPCVVASTANPYKFAKDVHNALTNEIIEDNFSSIEQLYRKTSREIPRPLSDLQCKKINFKGVITPDLMYDEVVDFINKQHIS